MGGRVFPHVGVLVSHYFCVAGDDIDVDGFDPVWLGTVVCVIVPLGVVVRW
jgi:hypothetical protein